MFPTFETYVRLEYEGREPLEIRRTEQGWRMDLLDVAWAMAMCMADRIEAEWGPGTRLSLVDGLHLVPAGIEDDRRGIRVPYAFVKRMAVEGVDFELEIRSLGPRVHGTVLGPNFLAHWVVLRRQAARAKRAHVRPAP